MKTYTAQEIKDQIKESGTFKSIGAEVLVVALNKPRSIFERAIGCFLLKNKKSYQVMTFTTTYEHGGYMSSEYAHALNDGSTKPLTEMMARMSDLIERYGMEVI